MNLKKTPLTHAKNFDFISHKHYANLGQQPLRLLKLKKNHSGKNIRIFSGKVRIWKYVDKMRKIAFQNCKILLLQVIAKILNPFENLKIDF